MEEDQTPPPQPPEPWIRRRRLSRTRILLELAIVTTGVLIALLLEGLVDWNHYRVLVRDARANIAREITDNEREVGAVLATLNVRKQRLAVAQQFADELIAQRKTDVSELNLGFEFAELTAAAWHGAQQTGALAHMDYGEVQEYTHLYDLQELYTAQQRRSLETLAGAMALFGPGGDPVSAAVDDLTTFRQHVLTLRAELTIEEQLAKRLVQGYQRFLMH